MQYDLFIDLTCLLLAKWFLISYNFYVGVKIENVVPLPWYDVVMSC